MLAHDVAPATMPPMPTKPAKALHLSVCIVLYNDELPVVLTALSSLRRACGRARRAGCLQSVRVEVVDNSSNAQVQQLFCTALGEFADDGAMPVAYRNQPANRGFGAGQNTVLAGLDSDVHLILNPDVELAEDSLQIALRRMAVDRGVVLLCPRVTSSSGRQEYLCKRYPSVLVLMLRAFAPAFFQRLFQSRLERYEMRDLCSGDDEVDVVLSSGCFMLVRSDVLRAVGGFDERYFLYFEDFDLSLRLRQQGRLVFSPAVKIVHHGGYAARKGIDHIGYFIRSGLLFFRQHGWRWL